LLPALNGLASKTVFNSFKASPLKLFLPNVGGKHHEITALPERVRHLGAPALGQARVYFENRFSQEVEEFYVQ
jgi:hypothetical protein